MFYFLNTNSVVIRQTVNETLRKWNPPKYVKDKKWVVTPYSEILKLDKGNQNFVNALMRLRKRMEKEVDEYGRKVWDIAFKAERKKDPKKGFKYAIYYLTCKRLIYSIQDGI